MTAQKLQCLSLSSISVPVIERSILFSALKIYNMNMEDLQIRRTKYGRAMYSFTMHCASFLSKHMWLWAVLNLTWGIAYSAIGAIAALALLIAGVKPHRFNCCTYFQFGDNWGGLEFVFFFCVANNMGYSWTEHTKEHELGHSFQNAIFGPFCIFIALIPSAVRYWVQRIRQAKGKDCKPYDLIWFEGSATDAGHAYCERIKSNGTKHS